MGETSFPQLSRHRLAARSAEIMEGVSYTGFIAKRPSFNDSTALHRSCRPAGGPLVMNVHPCLILGTMEMTMIDYHSTLQSNPFHTVPTTIFTILSEKFNEYAAAIRNVLRSSPKRKLTSAELRKEADLPAGKLLPVTEEMIKAGELYVSLDYSTQPPSHLYSLTPKGKAKL